MRDEFAAPGRIRVMVCDDSPTLRCVIARILRCDPAIDVVALAANGEQAAASMRRGDIDIVLLDVEMPVMDGLTALPVLLGIDPTIRVIMISALTTAGGAITMRALQAGAADYLPKAAELQTGAFAREVIAKVKLQARIRGSQPEQTTGIPLLPAPRRTPRLLAIGSSTGGPQALFSLFRALGAPLPVPIVVTQHMPPTFTRSLAEHINRHGNRSCREAVDDQELLPDQILIAPGDRHLTILATESGLRSRVTDEPAENSCRPAVDAMLRSASHACNGRVLGVVLTGMGRDGLSGARTVVDAGGCMLAQDRASSVVWGMPGAVARAGICHAVLPIDHLAAKIKAVLSGER